MGDEPWALALLSVLGWDAWRMLGRRYAVGREGGGQGLEQGGMILENGDAQLRYCRTRFLKVSTLRGVFEGAEDEVRYLKGFALCRRPPILDSPAFWLATFLASLSLSCFRLLGPVEQYPPGLF